MDKKNTVIGVLLLVAAMFSFYWSAKEAQRRQPVRPPATAPAPTTASSDDSATPATPYEAPQLSSAPDAPPHPELTAAPVRAVRPQTVTLENEFIAVTFTNAGGAIDRVALKKHLAVLGKPEPLELNSPHAAPALSFANFPGADAATRYEIVSRSGNEVVFRTTVPGQLEVTRTYTIAANAGNGQDPYRLRHDTTFRNLSGQPLALPRASVSLGTAAPVNDADYGLYLSVGYYNGEDAEFVTRGDLEGGGFLSWIGMKDGTPPPFIDRTTTVTWASVKNQFFASILTPDQPATGVRIERHKLDERSSLQDNKAYGVTGYAHLALNALPAGGSSSWGANYYAGPKEYNRLADTDHFKHNEDLAMQFGFFGFFAKILLTLLTWTYSWLPSWGWSVVVATIILKIATLPFTVAASRSSKRMQKLMPHVKDLREKFKDNPAKMNEAMMKLYKDNKVNPVGGCIPILITIPFFIGFFTMLQSASELRFIPFLWAPDLSMPDTVARIFGLPLNIFPLMMGATMIVQMRLTPTPTTDPTQATMMKIMPWIFTLFCYNFSCALALYSTVNGLFTIGQQLVINRMPDPELPVNNGGAVVAPGIKNVTPKKKKKN